MKKAIAVALSLGLLAGALVAPAEAGKKKKRKPKKVTRTAEGVYGNPAIGIPGVAGTSSAGGAAEFALGAKERFISIEITDDGGQPVTATLSQDSDPSTTSWEIFATICGATEEPLEVLPAVAVRVSVYTTPGPEQPTCMGPASSGTIKGTFSNLP